MPVFFAFFGLVLLHHLVYSVLLKVGEKQVITRFSFKSNYLTHTFGFALLGTSGMGRQTKSG